jgi:putative ABC transport system permease protein
MNIPLPREAYIHAPQVQEFYRELLDRVSNLPGVESADVSSDFPLNSYEMVSMTVEEQEPAKAAPPQRICQSWLLGDYFQTMGIPLLQGRWLTPEDGLNSQQVAVISRSAAEKLWPGQSPIGKRIRWGVNGPWNTVVGVVGDVSERSLSDPLIPHVYRPYSQITGGFLEDDPFGDMHAMNLSLRTHAEPALMTSAVVAQVHALDPDLAIARIRTMTEVISSSVAGAKFNTLLLGTFASLALLLAAIGIYGVLAYTVAQQTHEIGIRMALGAQRGDVLRMILKRGTRPALVGVATGAIAAVFLTRGMTSLLYGVSATDPVTFLGVAILLVLVALAACCIPARRAMRADPLVALRFE